MSNSNRHEKLQNRIQQSFLKRYAIMVGIVIILISLWFLFYFLPVQTQIKYYSQDVKEWINKIKLATVKPEDMDRLEKNVDSLATEISKIEKKIYYLDDMPIIAKQLIEYASEHQLQVQTMVPNYTVLFPVENVEAQGKLLVKLPLEIQMIGLFVSAGKFMEDVDHLPFTFAPNEVLMEADAKFYPRIRVTVKGYLFLLNEDKNLAATSNHTKLKKTRS